MEWKKRHVGDEPLCDAQDAATYAATHQVWKDSSTSTGMYKVWHVKWMPAAFEGELT